MTDHDDDLPRYVRADRPERSAPLPARETAHPCLRWNPLTNRAEPGHFTVHPADVMGPAFLDAPE